MYTKFLFLLNIIFWLGVGMWGYQNNNHADEEFGIIVAHIWIVGSLIFINQNKPEKEE